MKNKDLRVYVSGLSEEELSNFATDIKSCSMQRIFQKYNFLNLTKKNYGILLSMFGLKSQPKHHYLWITDGTTDKYVADDVIIQKPYVVGRSSGCSGTPGYAWYNNGVDTIYINPNTQAIPDGYFRGSLHRSTAGYHVYNDGIRTIYSKEVLNNLNKGVINTTNYKLAAEKRKKYYFNNGIDEIKLLKSDPVPDNFMPGRLPKKSIQEKIKDRDAYYDSIGYIPVKALSKDQLNGYRYYRFVKNFNLDIISKQDSYTYVNKVHLPLFEEYAQVNHSKGTSNMEKDLYDFLRSIYSGKIERNIKSIIKNDSGCYELDFYAPDLNLAVEFNGNFWRSSEVVPRNYHINKSKLCENLGIRLIHIYEYEWENPELRQKIESLLRVAFNASKNKIYARNCDIRKISNSEAKGFNNLNHLQGHRNAQVTYGLFYHDELVQLMSFSRTKYNRNLVDDDAWEIIRGCPGSNNVVVGGVSKLFKHFIDDYNPNSVFSYCDFNKFDGSGYEAIGMKFIGYTGPDMKWLLKDNSVVNRQPNKHTELKELAKAKIFGAGSKKYLWNKQNI